MVEIYIPELDEEVEFEGTAKYHKGFSGSRMEPPEEAGWQCEEVSWNESKYTTEQNKIIENYRQQAGLEIEKEYQKETEYSL